MKVKSYCFLLSSAILFVVLAYLLVLPIAVLSQENPCDPYLLQPKENPLGYRFRGDRCEGQYIEQVASTPLSVASFTQMFENYDLNSDRSLQIVWPKQGEQEIRLRAQGIKWKLYYRMDAVRSDSTTKFQWPVSILSALNIPKSSIGIVGWTHKKIGEATQKVYLPLRITQSGELTGKEAYRLVLWPGIQLKEVYVSLAMVDAKGNSKNFLQEGKPLDYGFYPAQRPIPVSFSNFQASGIYKVTISATFESGGATTKEFWFYHHDS